MKFRSKPTVIEAEQFSDFSSASCPGVCGYGLACKTADDLHVHTMHDGQIVMIEHGDWIVPEPDGEHYYPIKDAVFRAKYEAVEE